MPDLSKNLGTQINWGKLDFGLSSIFNAIFLAPHRKILFFALALVPKFFPCPQDESWILYFIHLHFFFFFFFMNGNTDWAQCTLSQVCISKKRKRKAVQRIKQIYKTSKRVIKKKSCHLVPKVVIDLPFEGRKVEGSRKYRRRERVPKAGSRREETITEPSCTESHQSFLQPGDSSGGCLKERSSHELSNNQMPSLFKYM